MSNTPVNGWAEYKRTVLQQLEYLTAQLDAIRILVAQLDKEVANTKTLITSKEEELDRRFDIGTEFRKDHEIDAKAKLTWRETVNKRLDIIDTKIAVWGSVLTAVFIITQLILTYWKNIHHL